MGIFKKTKKEKKEIQHNKEESKNTPTNAVLKGGVKIEYNNISIDGKSYNDWSEENQKAFWEGFDSNQLGNPNAYPFPELKYNNIIKNYTDNNKDDWKKKLNIGNPETDDGHWVTLKNHQHVFIKNT